MSDTTTCPFCSEEIQAAATRCRHCGEALGDGPGPTRARARLKTIAANQRAVLMCILVYLGLVVAQGALPADARGLVGLVALPLMLVATVFVYRLAAEVYSTAMGVVLALLTWVPCVGLLVLLAVNSRATSELKAGGIKVGLLGADASAL